MVHTFKCHRCVQFYCAKMNVQWSSWSSERAFPLKWMWTCQRRRQNLQQPTYFKSFSKWTNNLNCPIHPCPKDKSSSNLPHSFKWNSPNDEKDTLPLDMVKAGDHCERNISRHMLPLLFIFGWYILVVNETWNGQYIQNNLKYKYQKISQMNNK